MYQEITKFQTALRGRLKLSNLLIIYNEEKAIDAAKLEKAGTKRRNNNENVSKREKINVMTGKTTYITTISAKQGLNKNRADTL